MNALPFVVVFFATLACDFAWTKYNLHSAAKNAHRAAAWSSAIIAFGTINVISYTTNHWLVIPALLGAYVGTYLAIWWEKRQREPAKEPASDYCQDDDCTLCNTPSPQGHRKPMAQPYEGCQCNCCVPTGTPPRHSGTIPRCNHDNCDMEAADGGVVRWSCGSIEG
jgi:hypothetical protein